MFAAAGVLLVTLVGGAADVIASAGRIHPGVHVGEVAVGGKTVDEATIAIAEYVAAQTADPVTVSAGGAVLVTDYDGGLRVLSPFVLVDLFKVYLPLVVK